MAEKRFGVKPTVGIEPSSRTFTKREVTAALATTWMHGSLRQGTLTGRLFYATHMLDSLDEDIALLKQRIKNLEIVREAYIREAGEV